MQSKDSFHRDFFTGLQKIITHAKDNGKTKSAHLSVVERVCDLVLFCSNVCLSVFLYTQIKSRLVCGARN